MFQPCKPVVFQLNFIRFFIIFLIMHLVILLSIAGFLPFSCSVFFCSLFFPPFSSAMASIASASPDCFSLALRHQSSGTLCHCRTSRKYSRCHHRKQHRHCRCRFPPYIIILVVFPHKSPLLFRISMAVRALRKQPQILIHSLP